MSLYNDIHEYKYELARSHYLELVTVPEDDFESLKFFAFHMNHDEWADTEEGKIAFRLANRDLRVGSCLKHTTQYLNSNGELIEKRIPCKETTLCENCRNRRIVTEMENLETVGQLYYTEIDPDNTKENERLKKQAKRADGGHWKVGAVSATHLLTSEPVDGSEPISHEEAKKRMGEWFKDQDIKKGKRISGNIKKVEPTPKQEEIEEEEIESQTIKIGIMVIKDEGRDRAKEIDAYQVAWKKAAEGSKIASMDDLEKANKQFLMDYINALPYDIDMVKYITYQKRIMTESDVDKWNRFLSEYYLYQPKEYTINGQNDPDLPRKKPEIVTEPLLEVA